jgi:hypothetical protein
LQLTNRSYAFSCLWKIKISKNSHYAIEYGNGECDNLAMLAIGGTAKPIILEINFD